MILNSPIHTRILMSFKNITYRTQKCINKKKSCFSNLQLFKRVIPLYYNSYTYVGWKPHYIQSEISVYKNTFEMFVEFYGFILEKII